MRYLIVFRDESKREITGEDGKYWLTGETKIRKLSDLILRIEEIPCEEPKPKSAAKRSSKKKKEETAEE